MSEQGFSVRLSARVDGYLAAMEQAKKATKEVGDSGVNLDRLGGKMQDAGVTLSKSVTLPLIAAGGLAIKMSSDFESSFARMEGLAGVEAGEVDGLKKSVLDLAGETAQAPQKLADALYEASSAGLDTASAMDAVKMAAKGAAVGMGTAQDIVGLVASATAAYGKENITAAAATDILTASIKAGRADPAELAGSLGRILPIAAQLGISFDEVGGATAFLSNIMGDTAQTVTSLQGFFVQLLSPTKEGKQALIDMGTSVEDLHTAIDQNGLMGALDLLREKGFAANQDALRHLFPDVQAFQGALALVNDTSGALTGTLDATKNSTGALDTAFGLASDTAGFKMKQAWADVQVALIQAGDIIMPIASGIAGAVAHVAEIFTDLPGPVQKTIVVFLGLVAAAGPLLIVGGTLVKNFKEIKSAMSGLAAGATTASVALGAVGVVMIAATAWYADNARKKAELIAITNTFTQALNDEAAGQKGAVDAAIAAQLNNPKLIEQAKVLGLTVGDMAKIIKGELVPSYAHWQDMAKDNTWSTLGVDAEKTRYAFGTVNHELAPLNDGFENAQASAKRLAEVERDLTVKFGAGTASMVEHGGAVGGLAKAFDEVATVLPPTEEELKAIAETEQANSDATKILAKALKESTNVFEQLAGAASMLSKALHDVFDPTQNLEDTQQALNKAVAATTQSFVDNGKTLDINTDKGNANRDAIQAQANAAIAHATAMVGMGSSTAEATDFINYNIVALHDQMIAAGLTEDEVAAYLVTLGLTPENVNTAITLADTEATKLRIAGLQDQLGDIDAGAAALITADIEQGKFDEAESKLKWIARARDVQLNLTPGSGVRLIWAEGTTPLVRFGQTAMGGYFDREQIRSFAEGGRPEAALPLDNQPRLQALLSDPRIGAPISAAMAGLGGNPSGPVVNNYYDNYNANVNNNGRDLTVADVSRALAMARVAA